MAPAGREQFCKPLCPLFSNIMADTDYISPMEEDKDLSSFEEEDEEEEEKEEGGKVEEAEEPPAKKQRKYGVIKNAACRVQDFPRGTCEARGKELWCECADCASPFLHCFSQVHCMPETGEL